MAVTVTYEYPVAGIVAPTALQGRVCTCVATVIKGADGDTAATITHNMGLSAAQIAQGFPVVTITKIEQITAVLADWTVTTVTANTVVMTATAGAGSGSANPQIRVTVRRPHSITK